MRLPPSPSFLKRSNLDPRHMCSHRLVRGWPTASNIAQELLGHADLIKQISKDYQRDYPNMGHAGRRRDFRASSKDMEAAKHVANAFRAQLHRS